MRQFEVRWANLDAVRSIERKFLGDRIGALPAPRDAEVKRALGYALDWPELKTVD